MTDFQGHRVFFSILLVNQQGVLLHSRGCFPVDATRNCLEGLIGRLL
jgi:hypothetical protein